MIEWLKTERASTSPSSSVTVTQTGTPFARVRSILLAAEPCTYRRSPTRACSVGMTYGRSAGSEADVAEQRLVEDRVDRLAVVEAPLRLASDAQVVGHGAHQSSRR